MHDKCNKILMNGPQISAFCAYKTMNIFCIKLNAYRKQHNVRQMMNANQRREKENRI